MINIKGHYKIIQDKKIIYESDNLITFYGEIFILNRMINNTFEPIEYLVIGNAHNTPLKTDISLGNETSRRTCDKKADITNSLIRLTSSFNTDEIVGASEIGVATDKFLISHDTFEKINSEVINTLIGTVEIEYTFEFQTSTIRQDWTLANDCTCTYYVYEPSYVVGVFENKNIGYTQVNSKEEVEEKQATFYYDFNLHNLYIHPKQQKQNGVMIDIPPTELEILIQTRYNNESLQD